MKGVVIKKPKIVAVVSAVVITAALIIYISTVWHKKEESRLLDISDFKAVPTDLSSLFYFSSVDVMHRNISLNSPLFGDLFFGSGKFEPFIERLYNLSSQEWLKGLREASATISNHYSAKNQVDPLLTIKSVEFDASALASLFGRANRGYSGVEIYSVMGVECTSCSGFFLASTSPIILESSIRHLQSGTSIVDNEQFTTLVSQSHLSNFIAIINHSQIGKLFSGYVEREFLGYANFVASFANWSLFHLSNCVNTLFAEGSFVALDGDGNFVSLFKEAKGEESRVTEIVPHNTTLLLTLSVKDFERLAKSMESYRSYNRRATLEYDAEAKAWFNALNAKEVSLVLIPFEGKEEAVTIIRGERRRGRDLSPESREFSYKGYIAKRFGSIFGLTQEAYLLEREGWRIIGSQKLLKEFSKGSFDSFTLEHFVEQTEAHNLLNSGDNLLTLFMNSTYHPERFSKFFKRDIREDLAHISKKRNVWLSQLSLKVDKKGEVGVEIYSYADSLERMPQPAIIEEGEPLGEESDRLLNLKN